MFAIVTLAGNQQRVEKDQVLLSERTGHVAGSEFDCAEILMVGEGAEVKIGKPLVSGAQVKFKVLEDVRGTKVRGFIYRKRKGSKRTWGHRQELQKLQVLEIVPGS